MGGDATLCLFGAVDWEFKKFMVEDTSRLVEALSTFAGEQDHVEIIAVMELFAFVVFAAQEFKAILGQDWLSNSPSSSIRSRKAPQPSASTSLIKRPDCSKASKS